MSDFVNEIVRNLPPSGIRRFFDLVVSAGKDVVSLGVGEPDFHSPWHVRESAIFALEKGFTSYSENLGLFELREEIVKKTKKETGVKYNAKDEIIVTNGVSEGMDLAFRATVESGDVILVPNPGYVMYEPLIRLAGGTVDYYNPLDVKSIKVSKKTKGILLNYPGNPIGNTFSKIDLNYIANVAKKNDLLVYSDEIYGGLSFDFPHISFVSLVDMRERTILLNGLSKTHSMTGFRIGWACAPKKIISAMNKIHQYSALCASSISQIAAVEALRRGAEESKKMFEIFKERRDFCVKMLSSMNLKIKKPEGAFYIFADVSSFERDDVAFCENLLKIQKLAIVPGSAFGSAGSGYVRMTFAASMEELTEAFNRLEKFVKRY